jgi:hypothetical protein
VSIDVKGTIIKKSTSSMGTRGSKLKFRICLESKNQFFFEMAQKIPCQVKHENDTVGVEKATPKMWSSGLKSGGDETCTQHDKE